MAQPGAADEYEDDDVKSVYSSQSASSAQSAPTNNKATNAKTVPSAHLNVSDYPKALPSSADEADEVDDDDDDDNNSVYSNASSNKRKKHRNNRAEGTYQKLSKQERREFRMAFRLFDKDDD
eukprot:239237_1